MTRVIDYLDQIWNNLILLGRGTNAIALKMPGSGLLELRDTADSAYQDLRLRNVYLDGFLANSRVIVPRRQCVLAGQTSSGQPSTISAPGGLTAQVNASASQPLVVAFAAGFDQNGGAIDYVQSFTGAQGLSGISANTTQYFYAERNAGGTMSFGRVALPPIYSRTAPSSPSSTQHWFNTSPTVNTGSQTGMTMYEWSGSAWVSRQRVFLGEISYDTSSPTATTTYAYQRRSQGAWVTTSLNTTLNLSHNLGMTLAEAEASFALYGRLNSSDLAHALVAPYVYIGAGYGALHMGSTAPRLYATFLVGDAGIYRNSAGGWETAADLQLVVNGGW